MKARNLCLIFILFNICACTNLVDGSCNSAFAAPKRLDGSVSKDQLADALAKSGLQCVWQERGQNAKPELLVDSVRMGSAAFYKGLCEKDNIRSIEAADGVLKIQVIRGTNRYQVQLPLEPDTGLNGVFDLSAAVRKNTAAASNLLTGSALSRDSRLKAQKAGLDRNDPKIVDVKVPGLPVVDIGQQKVPIVGINDKSRPLNDMEKLVQYNIELIIDRTRSMSLVDGTNGMSKMEWCHRQVQDLAQRLKPFQKTVTVTTFNTTFQTYPDCSLDSVERIYAETRPDGNTDLVDPLMARLDAAAAIWHIGAKRTLIAVITDGLPNVPKDTTVVDRTLIDYTSHMRNPDEVVVTFLQIGDTFDGRDFCQRLDNDLVRQGAKYDIVNTVDFAHLKVEGLVNALLRAIVANKQPQ